MYIGLGLYTWMLILCKFQITIVPQWIPVKNPKLSSDQANHRKHQVKFQVPNTISTVNSLIILPRLSLTTSILNITFIYSKTNSSLTYVCIIVFPIPHFSILLSSLSIYHNLSSGQLSSLQ